MKTTELLKSIANWLESPNNEAMLLAEEDENCLKVVSEACVLAAALIKQAADEVKELESSDETDPKYQWTVIKVTQRPLQVDSSDKHELIKEFIATYDNGVKILKSLYWGSMDGEFDKDGGVLYIHPKENAKVTIIASADLLDQENVITPEAIDNVANLAEAFDASGDPALKKQASVLDELLLSIAAPPGGHNKILRAQSDRIEELRKMYKDPKKELDKYNKADDAKKLIEKSKMTQHQIIQEHPLSTRSCPEHYCQMARVGDNQYMCSMDKKVFDFANGFDVNGVKVPGGSVAEQTSVGNSLMHPESALFDSRESRLNYNK